MVRNLLSGWTKLVSSNALGGVLQLAALAVAAQALDLAALGIIVLIQTYAKVVDGLCNFQSVNVLTRFLADAEEAGDDARFRGLMKAGLLVDAGTALIATIVAVALLPLLAPVIGLGDEWLVPAMLFCLVIASRILGAAEAGLRCFDRFWAIGLRQVVIAAVTLGASLVAWLQGAGPLVFLAIWLCSEVVANVVFLLWSLLVLRAEGVRGIAGANARDAIGQSPRFWPMMWQTNATFGIRMLSQDADVLVAGAVLGPAPAGLLRTAKSIASMMGQFGRPLQQVSSAPISRLASGGDLRGAMTYALRIAMGAAAIGLAATAVMPFITGPILTLGFGEEFAAAMWVTVILVAARAIYLGGVTLLPLMLALDMSERFLLAVIAGTAAFAIALSLLIEPYGLVGIGLAHIAFEVVWALTGWAMVSRRVATRRRSPVSGAA